MDENLGMPEHPSNQGSSQALQVMNAANNAAEFPVLKAFQEYIEAEQAKGRRRMLHLAIFFICVLLCATFAFSLVLIVYLNNARQTREQDHQNNVRERLRIEAQNEELTKRNQELNDRFLQMALEGRVAASEKETRQKEFQQMKQLLEALREQVKDVQESRVPTPAHAGDDVQKMKTELQVLRANLEKEKIQAEKERLRQEQVERDRRRLYPNWYAQKEGRKEPAKVEKPASSPAPASDGEGLSQKDLDELERKIKEAKPVNLDQAKPVSYFKSSKPPQKRGVQEVKIPDAKGSPVRFLVDLDDEK